MDFDKFLNLIEEGKLNEAIQYKNNYIPNLLYKYYNLSDDEELNEKRLSTLEQGKIYLSLINQFNDPFEGKAFTFLDDETVHEEICRFKCEEFIEYYNKHTRICCFANPDEKNQNMPMWAHYANSHKGFCVEYKLDEYQKSSIYPVLYNPARIVGNYFIGMLKMNTLKIFNSKLKLENYKISQYDFLVLLSLTCKHCSWRHEKEYRALSLGLDSCYFSAVPNKIFIGMNCSKKHENRLVQIAKKFPQCEIYKMKETVTDEGYSLTEVKINVDT